MKLTFGKYKGQQLQDVSDKNYLEWMLQNIEWLSDESKQAISNRLINLQPLSTQKGTRLNSEQISTLYVILKEDLTEWEHNFINSVLQYGHITEKQKEVVRTIAKKVSSPTT